MRTTLINGSINILVDLRSMSEGLWIKISASLLLALAIIRSNICPQFVFVISASENTIKWYLAHACDECPRIETKQIDVRSTNASKKHEPAPSMEAHNHLLRIINLHTYTVKVQIKIIFHAICLTDVWQTIKKTVYNNNNKLSLYIYKNKNINKLMEIIMKEITYYTNNSNTLKTKKKNQPRLY